MWKLQTAKDFLAEQSDDDRTDWIVPNIIAPSTVTIFVAPRGLGKSLVLHALLVAVAGLLFLGRMVKQVPSRYKAETTPGVRFVADLPVECARC